MVIIIVAFRLNRRTYFPSLKNTFSSPEIGDTEYWTKMGVTVSECC